MDTQVYWLQKNIMQNSSELKFIQRNQNLLSVSVKTWGGELLNSKWLLKNKETNELL